MGETAADNQPDTLLGATPEEWLNYTDKLVSEYEPLTEVTLKDVATFVAEMTPVVGDAMAAKEVWDELQKDEPNYYLAGALGGAALVGLVPGLGDAAAKAIKKGAKEVFDVAKRVEIDPNALGSTGGNIRLRPEGQPTPKTSLNITPPAPLTSLEELLDYNNQVRQPKGMLDRDLVRPNDNILYRPDRGYRAIGPEGYQDFLESGIIRAVADNKKKLYETPYFMRGQSSSAYVREQGEDYIVEAPLDTSWRGAGFSGDKYVGPSSNQAITRDSPVRVFRRNDDGTFEVVFDNIGDTALLPSQFNRGGLVDDVTLESVFGFGDKLKSKIGFAEGGEVKTMEEQMKLFEEGGIADDGMSVDPVSGNEIPPGSLASEVRDDIPAQLSEGEYVVPADVLRYYGVRFFEDLRAEAKQGLAQMESNGRIGGEPVPAGGPQMGEGDLTPEEMAVLQEMGMNVGGYVPQQQPPEAVGNTTMQMGMSTGYDQGGLEDGVDRASITTPGSTEESLRKDYGLGFSFLDQEDTVIAEEEELTEVVTLYGPNGEVEAVILPSQQARYDELIEAGYKTDQVEVTTETTVGEELDGPDNDVNSTPNNNSTGTGTGLGTSVSQDTRDAISNAVTKGIVGLTGPVGAIADTVTGGKASDAINDIVDNIVDSLFGPDETNVSPETIATDAEAQSEGVDPTSVSVSQGSGSKGPSAAQVAAEEAMGLDPFGGDTAPSYGGGSTSSSTDSQSPGPDDGSRGNSTSPSTDNQSPNPSVAGAEVGTGKDGTNAVGPMNTGGLVQRRSKKKKK